MKNGWRIILGASAVAALQSGAHAQSATVREIVRVVKTIPSGASGLQTAKIDGGLNTGDRVRTGGRSAAGIRFVSDKSLLRIGELSEIVITSGKGRDAQMVRGRVLADYKTPTTLRSGNAIAAIRGTEVEVRYDPKNKRTQVVCYHGRVFVSAAKNPIRAGTPDELTGSTIRDEDLVGNDTDWVGAEIRFIDGPHNGEFRRVTAFDSATGTLTFDPPFTDPGAAGASGYLLVKNEGTKIVELGSNQGTDVKGDGDPSDPYGVPHKQFSGISRFQFFEELEDGVALYVYPGTPQHDQDRDENWVERDAIDEITKRPDRPRFDCGCGDGPDFGGRRMGLRNHLAHGFAHSQAEHRLASALAAQAGQPGQPGSSGGASPSPENRTMPSTVLAPTTIGAGRKSQFRFEPFAFASDNDREALGARVRYQATQGSVYAEAGYRFLRRNDENEHDLSEAFIHVKGKYGDVIAGRQHLFLGPSNNSTLGRLLGLESTDAVVYDAPTPKGFKQQVGYIFDTRAVRDGGFDAYYARGLGRLWSGNIGYSLMVRPDDGHTIGWQLDAAQPLVRNILDVYGEAGRDTNNRQVYTAGFYVPWAYHKFKVDVFAEYARREGVQEKLTLRLRKELGNGLLLVGFMDNRLGDSDLIFGGGLMWSKKFR